MTDSFNFEQTHPLYDEMLPVYQRNADLYAGGAAIERAPGGRGSKYLTRHPLEKNEQYAIRAARAAYRNYAAPTVDLFASSVTEGIERQGIVENPRLAPLLRDCDRQGSTPDSFFKGVITQAAAVGIEFVLVDMPQAETAAATAAQAGAAGLVPYFVRVPAQNIIAWDFAPDGSLAFVVQRECQLEAAGPFANFEPVKRITLWQKTGWQRYAARSGADFELENCGEYNFGRVPLVPFVYERGAASGMSGISGPSCMTGRSVIDDVASLIIRVFNQDSEMDKMLFDAAVPLLVAYGVDEEGEAVLARASSNLWRFSGSDTRLEYVETSGASYAAKRQQTLDDIDSIREISLRQTRPRGAGVESAEAKRLDAVQIDSQLSDFARSCSAAESLCWQLAACALGESEAAQNNIEVRYNGAFDPKALREKLAATYLELRRSGDISRETLWRQLGLSEAQIEREHALLAAEQSNI